MVLTLIGVTPITPGEVIEVPVSFAAGQYGAVEFTDDGLEFVRLRCYLKFLGNRAALTTGRAVLQTIAVYEQALEFRIGERNTSSLIVYVPSRARFCTPYGIALYRDQ